MKPGSNIEVCAHGLDEAGQGLGTAGAREVAVADLLPGERARVAIEHVSRHGSRAFGRVTERLGPLSPERVAPMCPAFGRCGGCAWQHLSYPAQLREKRARLVRALDSAGVAAEVAPVVAAPALEGYRNTGKYVAGARPSDDQDRGTGGLVLGGYAPRSHTLVDTAGCRVVEPAIDRVRAAACGACAGLPVYDEATRRGVLRYVVARQNGAGQVLAGLVTAADSPRDPVAGAASALAAHPEVAGVVWVKNPAHSGAILSGEVELLAGRDMLAETVAGVTVELGIRDFFQVNRDQARRLYARVAELVRGARRIVDVYSGVGGIAFTVAAAEPGAELLGIEHNPGAVAAANRAAEAAGLIGRARFVAASARDLPALAARVFPGGRPDAVIVNPPRKGLDHETRQALRELAPARIVYVSCGPESLARDLADLADGYAVCGLTPVDLMPGTAHVETVAALTRK